MFCWQCGKEIYPGAFFCTNCGTKVVQPQEAVQQAPARMMSPAETQEPEMPPAPGSAEQPQPAETQEPEMPPAPGSAEQPQPAETQEPVVAPATEPVAPPAETQTPVVQVPPAVIVPSAPVMQFREVQGLTPSESGVQGSGTTMPAAPGMSRYVSAIPVERKPAPKPLKKGVLIAVIIAAILVFLVGVIGAFYFAETDSNSDGGSSQGRREELEDDDSGFHREDIGEYSQWEKSDNIDEKKGEDPIEGNQPTPWENPIEGKRTPAFSGRDIYPGIDGYAEGKPGDSMHTYWFDYTVTGAYICTEYGGYRPKAGYEILVVEMVVRNTFDEWIPMFDDDFQAQWNDMSDNAYAWPIEDAELLGEDVLPAYYVLEEGQVAMGLLLFEVPVGYTDFSLAYWEIFDDNTYGDLFFLDFTVDRDQIDITI